MTEGRFLTGTLIFLLAAGLLLVFVLDDESPRDRLGLFGAAMVLVGMFAGYVLGGVIR